RKRYEREVAQRAGITAEYSLMSIKFGLNGRGTRTRTRDRRIWNLNMVIIIWFNIGPYETIRNSGNNGLWGCLLGCLDSSSSMVQAQTVSLHLSIALLRYLYKLNFGLLFYRILN
ncbi:MAG: hypothetical protein KUG81_09375, partial [Gammaproteobacteria bacterium]|nr:hypothetical protein [Gammaproteobacteria bacterium]